MANPSARLRSSDILGASPHRVRPRAPARAAAVLAILVVVAILAAAAAMIAASAPAIHPGGMMVDIGGRRLRLVCAGPQSAAKPTVLFESGAFGFAGDWVYVQRALTAQGVRSCAYDRAGMGLSDPSPLPRDGVNIAADLERLLSAAHVPGPYVVVGHSMAGARVDLFAERNPGRIAGLVLADAMTPQSEQDPQVRRYVTDFTTDTRLAARVASAGVLHLLAWTPLGDKIGLPPEEDAEKRRQFASARYNRTAAEEVRLWPLAAAQAEQAGSPDPRWPVAVVIAGALDPGESPRMQAVQRPAAAASMHGRIILVPGATHNGLLGARYSSAIVQGIDFVLAQTPSSSRP